MEQCLFQLCIFLHMVQKKEHGKIVSKAVIIFYYYSYSTLLKGAMQSWKLKFNSYKPSNYVCGICIQSDPESTLNNPAMPCITSLLKRKSKPYPSLLNREKNPL